MRTLSFIVRGQIISLDPTCDFSNIVPGTDGYLRAQFSFSPEWDGCVKVAGFYSEMGEEYPPQILKNGKTCPIPVEALKRRTFKIQVVGKREDFKIVTNKVSVEQNGGRA